MNRMNTAPATGPSLPSKVVRSAGVLTVASLFLIPLQGVSVHAQNALGGGDALDAGLKQTMSGTTIRRTNAVQSPAYGQALDASLRISSNGQRDVRNMPNFRPDFQVGNLLVTGGLAGGKNFRGDPGLRIFGESAVGYLAPGDFLGEVGSDDIFEELQGSAFSQIQYVNSPLANDRYASAVGMGMYEYRRDYTPADQLYSSVGVGAINQDRIRLDRTNAYTSSSNLYDTAVTPSSLFLMEDARSQESDRQLLLSVESNAIQGIYTRPFDPSIPQAGFGLYERAAIYSGLRNGSLELEQLGLPYQSATAGVSPEDALNGLGRDARVDDTRLEARIMAEIRLGDKQAELDAYEQVVRRLVEQYGENENVNIDVDPEVLQRVREEMDVLRDLTTGVYSPSDEEGNEISTQSLLTEEQKRIAEEEAMAEQITESDEPRSPESREEMEKRIEEAERKEFLDRAAQIIRNGGQIESFVAGQSGRIADLMKRGEDLLARGAFFDAEARFDHVLDINPGNPLALLGRANAQLGAGLFLSSALSLRKLFGNYPEITGTRLAPRLLPNRTRLIFAKSKLSGRIERGRDLSSYGICLAYVGWLLEEPETVEEGLALMKGNPEDQALAYLLSQVWLVSDQVEEPLDSK